MANPYDEKKALDPSTKSLAYEAMAPRWDMISHLLGGTTTMRHAGERYLPRHPHESHENYRNRLATTTLFNMTEMTLESLTSKPFSDPIKLDVNTPKQIIEFCKDVDNQSRNLHVFCRQWFREGLAKAFGHVLIDMPKIVAPPVGERTIADDIEEQTRPYWTLIAPENLIFASYTQIGNKLVPTHVRIWETEKIRHGFTEYVVNRIRVLEPGTWSLWEQKKDKQNKVVWMKIDSGNTDLDYIPLITFYANRDGDLEGKLPLEDLAHLNISHWQSSSDQRNILTVARFPMLAVSGAHDAINDDVMVIGPRQLLATRAENGKFYYVENEGKSIQEGAKDLAKLEQDMAAYGAEFLRVKPGAQTATARALDSAESLSTLQAITLNFEDAVNMALWMTADWMKVPMTETTEPLVRMPTDFGPEEIKDVDLRTLAEMRRNRDISRKHFVEELKRRGALVDTFDNEENVAELEKEPTIDSPFATGMNVDGSSESNVDNETKKASAKKPAKKATDDSEDS